MVRFGRDMVGTAEPSNPSTMGILALNLISRRPTLGVSIPLPIPATSQTNSATMLPVISRGSASLISKMKRLLVDLDPEKSSTSILWRPLM